MKSETWADIARRRLVRQGRRCGLCAKLLRTSSRLAGQPHSWQAHHIDGDRANNTIGNCTALCRRCHLRAHCGAFNSGMLLRRSAFHLTGWTTAELLRLLA